LRKTLHDEVRRGTEHQSLLQAALDDFDQAPIYTIHAFCQKVLQEHAFDHRLDFRRRLVDDRELLHCCLREIQRKDWPAHYGDSLRAVLELSGYDARWERTVVDLAARVRPACGHRLLPAVADDWLAAVPALDEEVRDARVRLQSLVGPLDATSLASHRLLRAYAKADKAQTHQERRRAVLLPALKWLADATADVRPAAAFQALLHRCGKHRQFADAGFRIVTSKLKKPALAKLPPQTPDILNVLEPL